MPFGTSAGKILGKAPTAAGELADFLAEPDPTSTVDDVKEIDLSQYMKSDLGSQGASTSDQTKAKNAANPNSESQRTAESPEAEQEAEAQGQLGNE